MMKQGYKMTPKEKELRFRQTLENQAQKMFSTQISAPNPNSNQVDTLPINSK